MTTYVPTRVPVGTSLDELGLRLSLVRLPEEGLLAYRRRLLLELRDRSDPTQHGYIKSISRKVGAFDERIAEIDIAGTPADPVVMVTSSRLRIYDDYANGSLQVDVDITSRDDAYFLIDVANAVNASTDFVWNWLVPVPADYHYVEAKKLLFGDNMRRNTVGVVNETRIYEFPSHFTGYPRGLWANDFANFQNDVGDPSLIVNDGDYAFYRDEEGRLVIVTTEPMNGNIYVSWSEWPYDLRVAHVRAYPYNDNDISYRHRNTSLDENGQAQYLHLNPEGGEIAHAVLTAHPLEWGE